MINNYINFRCHVWFSWSDFVVLNLQIQSQTNLPTGVEQGSQITVGQLESSTIRKSDSSTLLTKYEQLNTV